MAITVSHICTENQSVIGYSAEVLKLEMHKVRLDFKQILRLKHLETMFQGSKTFLGVDEHVSLHVTIIMLKMLT